MNIDSQTTPEGVNVSSCANPHKWVSYPHNYSHPHNKIHPLNEEIIHRKSQSKVDEALEIVVKNMRQWKVNDIEQPGYYLKNVEPCGKLLYDDGDSYDSYIKFNPCIENVRVENICKPKSSDYFGKSDEEVAVHLEDVREDLVNSNWWGPCPKTEADVNIVKEEIASEEQQKQEVEFNVNPVEIDKRTPVFNEIEEELPVIRGPNYNPKLTFQEDSALVDLNEMAVLSGIKPEIINLNKPISEKDIVKAKKQPKDKVDHPVKIPEFELNETTLKEVWMDLADKFPEDTDAREFSTFYRRNTRKDPISFMESWVYNDVSILTLSGLCNSDDPSKEISEDFRLALLRYITNDDMPEGFNLGLNDEVLLVNGAPTKISSKAIEMAFCGLAELMGPKKSIQFVGKLVSKKLKKVF